MIAEHAAALQYILQDDIYLLNSEKRQLLQTEKPVPQPITEQEIPQPEVEFVVTPFAPVYLGNNAKNFLITTHYPTDEHIADAHLAALSAVLKRMGYELADVAIINLYKHADADLDKLTGFFKPQRLLILGNKAIPAQSNITGINQIETIGGVKVLYSFGFDEMMTDVDKKRLFWEQVKNL